LTSPNLAKLSYKPISSAWGYDTSHNSNSSLLQSKHHFIVRGITVKKNLPVFHYGIKIKVKKVKLPLCLTEHHAMKTYWGSEGIAPHILDLSTR
jgi:hypothetical protein